MSGLMDELMGKLKDVNSQIEMANRLRDAIGNALNSDQQIDISKIILSDKNAFIYWIGTETGRTAVREFADKFISSK